MASVMQQRLSMDGTAALLGEKPTTLRQWLHTGLIGDMGRTAERERSFSLGDLALLKLTLALRDDAPITIKRAFPLAGGFLKHLEAAIAGPTDTAPLFAVVVRKGSTVDAFACSGPQELAEAVAEIGATSGELFQFTVVNLSALAEEIAVEWAVATGLGDKLRASFIDRIDDMTEAEVQRMTALIATAQRKLPRGAKVHVAPAVAEVTPNGTFTLPGAPEPMPAPVTKPTKVRA
jgi:hypothetical protein